MAVSLRAIDDRDTENIIRWRNSDFVQRNFFYRENLTEEVHKNWLLKVLSGEVAQFIIEADGCDIGSTFLRDIDKIAKKAEFGIFIGERLGQGKGYGTEACKLICEYGFEKLMLNKIYLRVFESNIGAIKSYKKAGFKIEGIFRDDAFLDGEYINTVFMAIFKEDI